MKNLFLFLLICPALAFGQYDTTPPSVRTNLDGTISPLVILRADQLILGDGSGGTLSNLNQLVSTNFGALATGSKFVDSVSGNDTTGTGSPIHPVATLTQGQILATNGDTVVVVRGTFSEGNLGKSGVRWHFAAGTRVDPGTATPVFLLTNAVTELVVTGEGTFTNRLVTFGDVTNATARISGDTFWGNNSTVAGMYLEGGDSNSIAFVFDQVLGHVGFLRCSTSYSSEYRTADILVEAKTLARMNPFVASGGIASSNLAFTIRARKLLQAASSFMPPLNFPATAQRLRIEGGEFSRNGFSHTSTSTNLWFKGVSVKTTNDWNIPWVKGTYHIELP